jgi:hypothetical protein
MKIHVLVVTLVASFALAAPAEAAAKKGKKVVNRGGYSAVQSKPNGHAHDVYVNGELIGRDPDPFIRSQMMRNPHPWESPD